MNRLLILLLFCCSGLQAAKPDIVRMRLSYREAVADEAKAISFLNTLQQISPKDAVTEGYIAATEAVMAKHAFLPTSKFTWCRQSMEHFRTAVAKAPEDLELRFLRVSVQSNLPSFLGMSKELEVDCRKIIELLPASKDLQLKRDAATLLIDQGLCDGKSASELRKYR